MSYKKEFKTKFPLFDLSMILKNCYKKFNYNFSKLKDFRCCHIFVGRLGIWAKTTKSTTLLVVKIFMKKLWLNLPIQHI
jgi:hypothetical protein